MTPTQKIIDWVNDPKRPIWWRFTIRLALEKGTLSNDDHLKIYDFAKMHQGLIEQTPDFTLNGSNVTATGFNSEKETITLKSITDVNNVGALLSEQSLSFSDSGITAIYGDNGSGKSSYTRILKNTCLSRGDKPPVLGNAFKRSSINPNAKLNLTVNGVDESIHWDSKAPDNERLKSIRVFDSSSSNHYINKEDSLDFKLSGMHLLDELIQACRFVKTKVSEEKSMGIILPSIVFPAHNIVSAFFNSLNYKTTVEQINNNCLTEDEAEQLTQKANLLIEMKGKSPDVLRKQYQEKFNNLIPLQKELIRLQAIFDVAKITELKTAYDDLNSSIFTLNAVSKDTFDGLPVIGIGSKAWKSMWDSAKTFIESIDKDFPPHKGQHCPLCLQDINELSTTRLTQFNIFLAEDVQKKVNISQRKFNGLLNEFVGCNINKKPYEGILTNIKAHKPDVCESIEKIFNDLSDIQISLKSEKPVFLDKTVDYRPLPWIAGNLNSYKEKIEAFKDDVKYKALMDETSKDISLLKSKEIIRQNKTLIVNFVHSQNIISKLNAIDKNTTITTITRLNSEISQSHFIDELKREFSNELHLLGFNRYQIQATTRGSSGQQLLKFTINANGKALSAIASEGEQKCISLAAFLAEIKADKRNSSVIFDDPINSLDHHWRREFANRIAAESKNRQVIVFTHDLAFLKMLEEANPENMSMHAVQRRGTDVGVCSDLPPWDAMNTKTRIIRLRERAVKIRKNAKTADSEQLNDEIRLFYSKKRETWERLVEECVISGIVERFSREVHTAKVRYLIDITQEDVDIINGGMDKCCNYLSGHDRAHDLGIEHPSPDEIDADITILSDYYKKLARRK